METNPINRPINNSRPINQLPNMNSYLSRKQSRIRLSTVSPKRLLFFIFFFYFFFFFNVCSLNFPLMFGEMCGFKYRHLLFGDEQSSNPPCSLHTMKPGHRFSLVHSTLPPFPCGTPTDRRESLWRDITSSLALLFLSAQAQFFSNAS